MGTKQKFWFRHPTFGKCLFKQARQGTGEDWSEKMAAELAQRLCLPHAREELATWNDNPGTISPAMLSNKSSLTHGNDILARMDFSYPRDKAYKVSEHTLDIVLQAVSNPAIQLPLIGILQLESLPQPTRSSATYCLTLGSAMATGITKTGALSKPSTSQFAYHPPTIMPLA